MQAAAANYHLPVVGHGEGINSFVKHNYDYDLSANQSLELGHELQDTGYVYHSDILQANSGNPYGILDAGQIDHGMDTIIKDMTDNGKLDVDYSFSADDWVQIEGMLREADSNNVFDMFGTQGQSFMHDLGPLLKGMNYSDGTDIVSIDSRGNWLFNDSDHELPQKAYSVIYRYLNTHDGAYGHMRKLVNKI